MRKVLARWLTAALLLGVAGTGWSGLLPGGAVALAATDGAARSNSQPVPLILVHGLGGSGDGFSGPLDLGLAQRFERAGYVEGKTLFRFDYQEDNNGDYTHVAASHLRPFLDQVRATTGAPRVDLLGYSMGGLVVRYLLNLPEEAGKVRTAVLLASPAHGSFAADIVKDAVTTAAYVEARPRLGPAVRWEAAAKSANAEGMATTALSAAPTNWDQRQYIFDKARQVFEPRLAAFLLQVRFGRNAQPLVDFLSWWQRAWPAERQALFDDAQQPPFGGPVLIGWSGGAAGAASFAPGRDLSLAYLNGLALHAAQAYVGESLRVGTTAGPPKTEPKLTASGKGRLVVQATGWLGIDPNGFAIDRLLAERFSLGPGGTGPSYLANYFLHRWNLADEVRRGVGTASNAAAPGMAVADGTHGPRYVVLAGTMPNLYRPWWPAVGPNDGAVEAASAWVPLGPRDAFYLLEGSPLATSHPALKVSGQVFERVLGELGPHPAPVRRLSPLIRRWWWRDAEWEEGGQLAARRWVPAYLDIDTSRLKGRTGRLTIEVETGRNTWGILGRAMGKRGQPGSQDPPQVWVEEVPEGDANGHPETESRVQPLTMRRSGGRWIGALTLEDFGLGAKHIRVGMRLDGEKENLPANDAAVLTYRVRLNPAPEKPAATPAAVTPAPVSPVTQPDARPAGPGTIWVRRWTRQTTSRDPGEEGHAYWQWDFGDGATVRDDEPAHTQGEIEHQFQAAGTYRVTATSVSNLGQVLRRQVWDVVVSAIGGSSEGGAIGGGQSQRFSFETVRPPWLRLELEGPEKWVTGRPATYQVRTESLPVPWVERQKITVDPAGKFQVGWEKPGTYVVAASVMVETTYRLPEGGRVTVRSTYRVSRQVKVYTPVLAGD
ncbi:MAG: alpha/beta fold hydrolase [Symbiobacteriia bacterium]